MTDLSDGDDLAAAEYVLGTLDADERDAASARIGIDAAFAGSVEAWSRRLGPLSEGIRDETPSSHVWAAIVDRLGFTARNQLEPPHGGEVAILRRRVQTWRWATIGVSALAACLAGFAVVDAFHQGKASGPTLVAVLQKTSDTPAYIVKADLSDRTLSVRPIAVQAPPGRSYELWIIDPSLGAPKSLGIIDGTAPTPHPLPAGVTGEIAVHATYAVTDEPSGGSPNGAPSGAPVFVGHLVSETF